MFDGLFEFCQIAAGGSIGLLSLFPSCLSLVEQCHMPPVSGPVWGVWQGALVGSHAM